MKRIAALLLLVDLGLGTATAQDGGGSPYSAYGFGDMVATGQATQAMMAGAGLGLAEPYSVVLGNPASYTSLHRPVFEVGALFRQRSIRSAAANSTRKEARFMGFTMGVPFANGKWGLALGLTPVSEVDYALARNTTIGDDPVQYRYAGSGGLDRAFFGLGRTLYRQGTDSLGHIGHRVTLGADFNFLFGNLTQTRDAVYPLDAGYTNVRAFSTMILRAPAANASLLWQGDLTRKKDRDDGNWRWSVGISANLPTDLKAKYREETYSYVASGSMETIRDTISLTETTGSMGLPIGTAFAVGVQDDRWGITAEIRQRNWGATTVDVPGYSMAAPMREATSISAAARFQPGNEGGAFKRSVYRLGVRHDQEPQEIRGQGLSGYTLSAGLSIPLNAMQTNSWLHIGGEFGDRGTTGDGLLHEKQMALWVGITFTPWRGERWFQPFKIQ